MLKKEEFTEEQLDLMKDAASNNDPEALNTKVFQMALRALELEKTIEVMKEEAERVATMALSYLKSVEAERDAQALVAGELRKALKVVSKASLILGAPTGEAIRQAIEKALRITPSAAEARVEAMGKALEDIARGPLQGPHPFEEYAVRIAKQSLTTPSAKEKI